MGKEPLKGGEEEETKAGKVTVTVSNSYALLDGEYEGSEMIEAAQVAKALTKAEAEKERVAALEEAKRQAKKEKKRQWKKAKREALLQGRPQGERVYVGQNHEGNNQNDRSDLNHGNNNLLRRTDSHPAQNGGGNSYKGSNGYVNARAYQKNAAGYQQNNRGGDYNQAYNNGKGSGYRGASRHSSSDRSLESNGGRKGHYVNIGSHIYGGNYSNGMRSRGSDGYNGHVQAAVSHQQVEKQGQDGSEEENDCNWWKVENGRGRRGKYIQVIDDNLGQEGQLVEKKIGDDQVIEASILMEKKEGETVNGDDKDNPVEGDSNLSTEDGKEGLNESDKSAQDDSKMDGERKHVYEPKTMTLKEYEKIQLQKKAALESLKKEPQRKQTIDKDFETMQLVKKETDDPSNTFNRISKEETLKKKGSLQDEKVRQLAKSITVGFKFPRRPKPQIWRGGERGFVSGDRSEQLDGSLPVQDNNPNEGNKHVGKERPNNDGGGEAGQKRPNYENKEQFNVGNRVDGVVDGERVNDKPINAGRGSGRFSHGDHRGRGRPQNFIVDEYPRQFPALGEQFIPKRGGGHRGRPSLASVPR